MIKINNLQKKYNDITVLDIPSLTINKGDSLGLVGNNGAGKTTFFRLILDIIEPSLGDVEIDGERVARKDGWKSKVGAFLDEGFLIDFLTPDEFFEFTGKLYGKTKGDIACLLDSMSDFFNGEIIGTKKLIRDLSKGNQKKVGITTALIGDPEILILDEPFTALDPSSQIRLKKILNHLQSTTEITMLISSHDLSHITDVCKRTVILEKGNIIKDIVTSQSTLEELELYFTA